MNNKEIINSNESRTQNSDLKKLNRSQNSKKRKDIDLPWWVELLFVQIGLPDKILIKLLKAKKKSKELIQKEKNSLIKFILIVTVLGYFYPVIKHAKNKLDCETYAKNYIIKNKSIIGLNNKELKMLSTNFCYGGEEIYEIETI